MCGLAPISISDAAIFMVRDVVDGKRNQPVSVAMAAYSQLAVVLSKVIPSEAASSKISSPVAAAVTSLNSCASSWSELTWWSITIRGAEELRMTSVMAPSCCHAQVSTTMMASAAGTEDLGTSEFNFRITPGGVMNSRLAGGAEALRMVTVLPSARRMARSPSSDPRASASGRTWLVMMNDECF